MAYYKTITSVTVYTMVTVVVIVSTVVVEFYYITLFCCWIAIIVQIAVKTADQLV